MDGGVAVSAGPGAGRRAGPRARGGRSAERPLNPLGRSAAAPARPAPVPAARTFAILRAPGASQSFSSAQTKFSSTSRSSLSSSGLVSLFTWVVSEKVSDRRPSGVAAISWV